MIESPNFPEPYPHTRDCLWTIAAPRGNRVNITFSHFEVEEPSANGTCLMDYVEIFESSEQVCLSHILQLKFKLFIFFVIFFARKGESVQVLEDTVGAILMVSHPQLLPQSSMHLLSLFLTWDLR